MMPETDNLSNNKNEKTCISILFPLPFLAFAF